MGAVGLPRWTRKASKCATENDDNLSTASDPEVQPKTSRKWSQNPPEIDPKTLRNRTLCCEGGNVISSNPSITFAQFWLSAGLQNRSKIDEKTRRKTTSCWIAIQEPRNLDLGPILGAKMAPKMEENRCQVRIEKEHEQRTQSEEQRDRKRVGRQVAAPRF